VFAPRAELAEVLAKAVLLRGVERAFDLLDSTMAALAVGHDGRVFASEGLAAYLGGKPLLPAVHFDTLADDAAEDSQ
jgi:hypothetical protein